MNITSRELLLEEQRRRSIMDGYTQDSTYLSFFSVKRVNKEDRTVDIEYMYSGTTESGIRYISPFIGENMGIDYIPRVGDVGIVATTITGTKIILGFMYNGEKSFSGNVEQGDIVTMSSGGAFIREDNAGNISIVSKSGAGIMISSEGKMFIASDQSEVSTFAKEESETADMFGNMSVVEKLYREIPSATADSSSDLISEAIETGDIELSDRTPIISTYQISKVTEGGKEQMDSRFDGAGDIVYQKNVHNDMGEDVFSFSVDQFGNALLKCRKFFVEESDPINLSGKGTINGTEVVVYHPFLTPLSTVIIVVSKSVGEWTVSPGEGKFTISSTEIEDAVKFEWFVER